MNKNNNKGFTLLELIIAMSIFVIIISIGYGIIKKYNISTNEQASITQSQLSINTLNEFITKDLEQAQGITLESIESNVNKKYDINNNEAGKDNDYLEKALKDIIESNKIISYKEENKLTYKYTIKKLDELQSPSYTVEMKYNKGSSYIEYYIYRSLKGGSNIEIVSNCKIKKDSDLFPKPISITKNNPYTVTIENKGKNDKLNNYEFQVASRIITSSYFKSPKPPKPEELPSTPGFGNDYSTIGFWTADEEKCSEDNLYTWVSYQGKTSGAYGKQEIEKDIFKVNAKLSSNDNKQPNDNSGRAYAHIGDSIGWKASVDLKSTKAKDIDKLMIYVQGCTTVSSFKDDAGAIQDIVIIRGTGTIEDNDSNGWILYGGDNKDSGTWYEAKLSGNKKENFDLDAKLSINKDQIESGYALVVYGENRDAIEETLVLNCDKKNKKWDKSILLNGVEIKSAKDKDNIFSNFAITIDRLNGTISGHHIGGEPSIDSTYEKIKNLKGIKIRLEGGIKLSDIAINSNVNIQINEINGIYESYFNYTPNETQNINIRGNINDSSNLGDNAKIILEFIY